MAQLIQQLGQEDKDKKTSGSGTMDVSGQGLGVQQPGAAGPQKPAAAAAGPSQAIAPASRRDARKTGTGFTNLAQYMQANQPKAQQMSQAVYGQAAQAGEQAQQQLAAGQKTFTGEAQKAGDILAGQKQFIQQMGQQGSAGLTQENLQKLQDIQGAEDVDLGKGYLETAGAQAQALQKMAGLAGTESGRSELLRQRLGRQGYTAGQRAFDTALMSSDPEAATKMKAMKDIAEQFGEEKEAAEKLYKETMGIPEQVEGEEPVEPVAGSLAAQQAETRELLKSTLGVVDDPTTPEDESAGLLGGLGADIRAQYEDVQAKAAEQAAIKDRIREGTHTKEDLEKLGIGPGGAFLPKEQLLAAIETTAMPGFEEGAPIATEQLIEYMDPEQKAAYESMMKMAGYDTTLMGDTGAMLDQAKEGYTTFDREAIDKMMAEGLASAEETFGESGQRYQGYSQATSADAIADIKEAYGQGQLVPGSEGEEDYYTADPRKLEHIISQKLIELGAGTKYQDIRSAISRHGADNVEAIMADLASQGQAAEAAKFDPETVAASGFMSTPGGDAQFRKILQALGYATDAIAPPEPGVKGTYDIPGGRGIITKGGR